MKSVFTVTARDFPNAVVDTRYDLRVVDVTEEESGAVREKLRALYGRDFAPAAEYFVEGSDSLFKPRYSDGDLLHVMRRLTDEGGCPWDRAQTHESIRINAVEEAYELCEAIDNRDVENMEEEVGDLLLQAVFHADIAERSGEFTRLDVVNRLVQKLVSRHTHIFGEDKATDADEALKRWEAAKAVEKKAAGLPEQLARIPDTFPALLRLQKTLKKLYKAGLVNDVGTSSVAELFRAACGCVASGADLEVELSRLTNELAAAFVSGEAKSVGEFLK